MVGIIALLDDRLQLANGQSPLLIAGAGRGHAAGGRGPGVRHARSGEPASRGRHAPLRRAPDRAGAPLERHDRDLRRRRRHPLCQPLVRAVARRGARRARRPASRRRARAGGAARARSLRPGACAPRIPNRSPTFSIPQAEGEKRSYKMVIANLCHVESIRGITLNIRDISDATRLHDQLRTLAFHDSLTLLANRSLFTDRVHQAIRHIADGMTPAVLFIDLDNFKTVNDSLGHSAGDQLLRGFAHRLVQCTRAGDTVARLGGDEFAVLIDHAPECRRGDGGGAPGPRRVPPALRDRRPAGARRLQRRRGARGSRQQRRATAAQCRRGDVLGQVARQGPRRSLRSPKCCAPRAGACASRTSWPTAIEELQLEAHYQPIVDLTSRHLVGVEALMRWRHPTRGLVMPGDFIPLAEETGQIVPMTQWMLNRACADLARLQRDMAHGEGTARLGQRVEPLSQPRQHRRGRAQRARHAPPRSRLPDPRSDREPAAGEFRAPRAHLPANSRRSACGSRSMTSAPAIPRSPICIVFPSTSSRSTGPSSSGWQAKATRRRRRRGRAGARHPFAGRRARPRHRGGRHRASTRSATRCWSSAARPGRGILRQGHARRRSAATPRSRAAAGCSRATCPGRSNTRATGRFRGIDRKAADTGFAAARRHDITPGMVLIIRSRAHAGRPDGRKAETCVGFRPKALV